jgi:hypothetical protein
VLRQSWYLIGYNGGDDWTVTRAAHPGRSDYAASNDIEGVP